MLALIALVIVLEATRPSTISFIEAREISETSLATTKISTDFLLTVLPSLQFHLFFTFLHITHLSPTSEITVHPPLVLGAPPISSAKTHA